MRRGPLDSTARLFVAMMLRPVPAWSSSQRAPASKVKVPAHTIGRWCRARPRSNGFKRFSGSVDSQRQPNALGRGGVSTFSGTNPAGRKGLRPAVSRPGGSGGAERFRRERVSRDYRTPQKRDILGPYSYEPVRAPDQLPVRLHGRPGCVHPTPQDPRSFPDAYGAGARRRLAIDESRPHPSQRP